MRERIDHFIQGTRAFIEDHKQEIALGMAVVPALGLMLRVLDENIDIQQKALEAWRGATSVALAAGPEEDLMGEEGVIFEARPSEEISEQIGKEAVYIPSDRFLPGELAVIRGSLVAQGREFDGNFIPVDVGLPIIAQRSDEKARLAAEIIPLGYLDRTSLYMSGRVRQNVVFLESTGDHEPSTEDWTEEMKTKVILEKGKGGDLWVSFRPSTYITDLSFHPLVPFVGYTGYEPINHPHTDVYDAIEEAMANLGYGPEYGGTFARVRAFNLATLAESGSDWVNTTFVVNSENDPDGEFSDGRIAFACLGGPLNVLTWDNGIYGVRKMYALAAHEDDHLFWGLDQHREAEHRCNWGSGYLDVFNRNSRYDLPGDGCFPEKKPSIMNSPYEETIDFPDGAGQIGLRDSDEDGREDPRDTHTILSFIGFSEEDLILEVEDRAFPPLNPWMQPFTINHIVLGEYYDGDRWNPILAPGDGSYDETTEEIRVPTVPNQQCIAVKGTNRVGNVRGEAFSPTGEKLPLGLTISPLSVQLPVGAGEFCCFRPGLTGCGVSLGEPYYGEVSFEISGRARVSPEGRVEKVVPGLITQTLTLTATISPGGPEQVATATIVVPPLRTIYLPVILRNY